MSPNAAKEAGPDGEPSGAIVIGWGQGLRGDDAAGHLVAEAVQAPALPGVRVETAQLLTPELAYDLSRHVVAVLVDADAETAEVRVEKVRPSAAPRGAVTHTLTAEQLLALCETAYGVRPRTWLVGVPAEDFGLGDGLSRRTREGVKEATRAVREILKREGAGHPPDGGLARDTGPRLRERGFRGVDDE